MCKVSNEHRTKKIKCCWYFGVIELAYENVLKLFFFHCCDGKFIIAFLCSFLLQIFHFTFFCLFTCGSFLIPLNTDFDYSLFYPPKTRNKYKIYERKNLREKLRLPTRKGKSFSRWKTLQLFLSTSFNFPFLSFSSLPSTSTRRRPTWKWH